MKRHVLSIALCIAAMPVASAQTVEQLIKACEALKRQSDRNKCLEETIRSASKAARSGIEAKQPSSAIESEPSKKEIAAKRSEQVFAAASALQSVADLGVSYNDYKPYIQKLAVELGSYKASVQLPEERQAVEYLEKALQAYDDAREYWYADIDFYSRRSNQIAYSGSLPMALAGVSHIVSKYRIPTQKSDLWGINYGATRGAALSTIWGVGKQNANLARVAISFEQKEVAAADAWPKKTETELKEIAERMVLTKVGSIDSHLIANVFINGGRFLCGMIAPLSPHSDSDRRLFMANQETGSVYLEGTNDWSDAIWPTFCR